MLAKFLSKNTTILILSVLIFITALFTRFYQLELVPPSLANDEMIYAIHALSVAHTGTDLSGTWNPFSLTPMNAMFGELPTLFQSVFFLLPLPLILAARLPFVLMSLLLPAILAGISWELFRNRRTAIATGFVALFNPWIWQFGRMGFDSYWSVFFYSLGAYLLLHFRGWKKCWSMLAFFLAFYQYQGHKLSLIPWVLAFVAIAIWNSIQFKKLKQRWHLDLDWKKALPSLTVLMLSCLLFVFYIFIQLPQQGSSVRISTMVSPNSPEIIQEVNEKRTLSLASPLTPVFTNKYTVWAEEMLTKYSKMFAPEHLFVSSQFSSFNVWSHGLFYLIDAALLLISIVVIARKKTVHIGIILGITLCAVVVAAAIGNGDSYLFRSSLSIPLLLLFVGVGASFTWRKLPSSLRFVFLGLYIASIGLFAFQYFVRYPVYSAERSYLTDRVLSRYVQLSNNPVVIYTDEPDFTYMSLVFYNRLFDTHDFSALQQQYRERSFEIGNVRLTAECVPSFRENIAQQTDTTIIVRASAKRCQPEEEAELLELTDNALATSPDPTRPDTVQSVPTTHSLGAVRDSGMVYEIVNDTVCQETDLPGFIHITELRDFALQKQTAEEFCSTWVMK